MNKKTLIPSIVLAMAVIVMFSAAAFSNDWFMDYNAEGEPTTQEFGPNEGVLSEESINYQLFEEFGPILLVLAILMFGAIIGGVYIAREDEENDTD